MVVMIIAIIVVVTMMILMVMLVVAMMVVVVMVVITFMLVMTAPSMSAFNFTLMISRSIPRPLTKPQKDGNPNKPTQI